MCEFVGERKSSGVDFMFSRYGVADRARAEGCLVFYACAIVPTTMGGKIRFLISLVPHFDHYILYSYIEILSYRNMESTFLDLTKYI